MIRAKVLGRKYSTYNLDLRKFAPLVSAHCYCASKSTRHVHCLPQRPRSFWSAPRIATLGADQRERGIWKRECENIGPPFDLRMLRVQRNVSILFCFCSFELSKQPIALVNVVLPGKLLVCSSLRSKEGRLEEQDWRAHRTTQPCAMHCTKT